jgi:ParB-like chromosome segregation protein Spo0J
MTDISSIPLNKLVASPNNVRKTAGADSALQELAASIAKHGLLQLLVVLQEQEGQLRGRCKAGIALAAGRRC